MPNLPSVFRIGILSAALVFFGGIQQASADDNALKPLDRPDPKSVAVPDLAFAPTSGDISDYDEYYYFYKQGVSYEHAFADLDQCRMLALETKLSVTVPTFVPLGSDFAVNRSRADAPTFNYGLVGVFIGAMIIPGLEDDNTRANDNRCMAYKGYSRYGTSSGIWNKINSGADSEKLARQALIASGPPPPEKAIDP